MPPLPPATPLFLVSPFVPSDEEDDIRQEEITFDSPVHQSPEDVARNQGYDSVDNDATLPDVSSYQTWKEEVRPFVTPKASRQIVIARAGGGAATGTQRRKRSKRGRNTAPRHKDPLPLSSTEALGLTRRQATLEIPLDWQPLRKVDASPSDALSDSSTESSPSSHVIAAGDFPRLANGTALTVSTITPLSPQCTGTIQASTRLHGSSRNGSTLANVSLKYRFSPPTKPSKRKRTAAAGSTLIPLKRFSAPGSDSPSTEISGGISIEESPRFSLNVSSLNVFSTKSVVSLAASARPGFARHRLALEQEMTPSKTTLSSLAQLMLPSVSDLRTSASVSRRFFGDKLFASAGAHTTWMHVGNRRGDKQATTTVMKTTTSQSEPQPDWVQQAATAPITASNPLYPAAVATEAAAGGRPSWCCLYNGFLSISTRNVTHPIRLALSYDYSLSPAVVYRWWTSILSAFQSSFPSLLRSRQGAHQSLDEISTELQLEDQSGRSPRLFAWPSPTLSFTASPRLTSVKSRFVNLSANWTRPTNWSLSVSFTQRSQIPRLAGAVARTCKSDSIDVTSLVVSQNIPASIGMSVSYFHSALPRLVWTWTYQHFDCTVRVPIVIGSVDPEWHSMYAVWLTMFTQAILDGVTIMFGLKQAGWSDSQGRGRLALRRRQVLDRQKNREEAIQQQHLMRRQAHLNKVREQQRQRENPSLSGLVILEAVYGFEDGTSGDSLDVTVPLQFWVLDSTLVLRSGTKGSLLGFYDLSDSPQPPRTRTTARFSWWKWWSGFCRQLHDTDAVEPVDAVARPNLRVLYSYGGESHEVRIRDDEPLIVPPSTLARGIP
jgi:Domain of unknown function (DUF3395)